jgi:hypothetical protein
VFPTSFLPFHPILVTLIGGFVFLLLVIPLNALMKAVSKQDMLALSDPFQEHRARLESFRDCLDDHSVFSLAGAIMAARKASLRRSPSGAARVEIGGLLLRVELRSGNATR